MLLYTPQEYSVYCPIKLSEYQAPQEPPELKTGSSCGAGKTGLCFNKQGMPAASNTIHITQGILPYFLSML